MPRAINIIKNPAVATDPLAAKAWAVRMANTAIISTRVNQVNNKNQVLADFPTYWPMISPTDFPLCRTEVIKPK